MDKFISILNCVPEKETDFTALERRARVGTRTDGAEDPMAPRLADEGSSWEPYVPETGRGGFLRMDANEGPPPPRSLLREALADSCGRACFYPEYGDLVASASAAWNVDPASVIPVNGADEGIRLAVQAYCGEGAPLAVYRPTFPMYAWYAGRQGAPVLSAPAALDRPPRAADMTPRQKRAALVAVPSPGNPVGLGLPEEELERLLSERQGRPFLLDETYGPFSGRDGAPLLRRWPNLLLLRSLSKAHGVPGLRCGFLLAEPRVAGMLRRLCPPFAVSSPAAAVGAWLLRQDLGAAAARNRSAVRAAAGLARWLAERGVRVLPTETHFFLAGLGAGAPARLRRQGILVKGMEALEPGLARVSVADESAALSFRAAWPRVAPARETGDAGRRFSFRPAAKAAGKGGAV